MCCYCNFSDVFDPALLHRMACVYHFSLYQTIYQCSLLLSLTKIYNAKQSWLSVPVKSVWFITKPIPWSKLNRGKRLLIKRFACFTETNNWSSIGCSLEPCPIRVNVASSCNGYNLINVLGDHFLPGVTNVDDPATFSWPSSFPFNTVHKFISF